jgi:hypothetical protein
MKKLNPRGSLPIDDREHVSLSFSNIRGCSVCGKRIHATKACYAEDTLSMDQWNIVQSLKSGGFSGQGAGSTKTVADTAIFA